MDRLDTILSNLKAFNADEAINRVIAQQEAELVQMNQEQLLRGESGEGESITPEYALSTQKRKHAGARPVTLYDTGKFHSSFFIRKDKKEAEFTSTPNETGRGFSLRDHLKKVYGKDIFGLTEANLKRLQALCKEQLIIELRALI